MCYSKNRRWRFCGASSLKGYSVQNDRKMHKSERRKAKEIFMTRKAQKKFELTDEQVEYLGKTLYRIRALKEIPNTKVKRGDLGGFVEKEENLSQKGTCWIYDSSWVYENAMVKEHAKITGNSRVYGRARVGGHAKIDLSSRILEDATIDGCAIVKTSQIYGEAFVSGNARVFDGSKVFGKTTIKDLAVVTKDAEVYGSAKIIDQACISNGAQVGGTAEISGKIKIDGAVVIQDLVISGRATLQKQKKLAQEMLEELVE